MDAHLEAVPGLGALPARGLARGYAQHLGGHAHRALDLQLFVLRTTDQVRADCAHIDQHSITKLWSHSITILIYTFLYYGNTALQSLWLHSITIQIWFSTPAFLPCEASVISQERES